MSVKGPIGWSETPRTPCDTVAQLPELLDPLGIRSILAESGEEAADIMEVFHFICNRMGIKDSEIMAQSTSKRILRGGFEMGYILEWVEEE